MITVRCQVTVIANSQADALAVLLEALRGRVHATGIEIISEATPVGMPGDWPRAEAKENTFQTVARTFGSALGSEACADRWSAAGALRQMLDERWEVNDVPATRMRLIGMAVLAEATLSSWGWIGRDGFWERVGQQVAEWRTKGYAERSRTLFAGREFVRNAVEFYAEQAVAAGGDAPAHALVRVAAACQFVAEEMGYVAREAGIEGLPATAGPQAVPGRD